LPLYRGDIRRGEVYLLAPEDGAAEAASCHVVVVGVDAGNRNDRYPFTLVVPVGGMQREILTHVILEPDLENGLPERMSVRCEQVMAVRKDGLQDRVGRLDAGDMARVDHALKRALAL
jgi:mRNA-degrading endonuclease toxin of MazEF toxin-antitoxin module